MPFPDNAAKALQDVAFALGDIAATLRDVRDLVRAGKEEADRATAERSGVSVLESGISWKYPGESGFAPASAEEVPPAVVKSQRWALVVDDDQDLAEVLTSALRDVSSFHEIRRVFDIFSAKTLIGDNDHPPAFVLSDVSMTGPADGITLATWLRDIFPATKVVLMTAGDADKVGKDTGFCCLQKPFAVESLLRVMRLVGVPKDLTDADPVPVSGSTAEAKAT